MSKHHGGKAAADQPAHPPLRVGYFAKGDADPITPEAISNWFAFHPSTDITGPQHDKVRQLMRATARKLASLVPPGADRTIAIRKLRESMFYANAGIACAPPDDRR